MRKCKRTSHLNCRRLENLENPSAPPITVYRNDVKLQNLRSGLSPADQQLIDRLENLKDDKSKPPPPSEGELRKRLAKLKGENNYVERPSKNVSFFFSSFPVRFILSFLSSDTLDGYEIGPTEGRQSPRTVRNGKRHRVSAKSTRRNRSKIG